MQIRTFTLSITLLLFVGLANGQGVWTQKANVGGGARAGAICFTINGKGYCGTGNINSINLLKDFWEYDPVSDSWSQKADFPLSSGRTEGVGFSIGNKGYLCTGLGPVGTKNNDLWEFDPSLNTWTQKTNFGGATREHAVAFTVGNKGYVGTGSNNAIYYQDFWEYSPSSDSWTQKADFGGGERLGTSAFSVGAFGYVGLGMDGTVSYYNDFWRYHPSSNTWLPIENFPDTFRVSAAGFSIGKYGFVGTGSGLFSHPKKDFWGYNTVTNKWFELADVPGDSATRRIGFSIGNYGYIGAGQGYIVDYFLNSFWRYTPDTTLSSSFVVQDQPSLSLFPNPFSSEATIRINNNSKNTTLTILNSSGQLVRQLQHLTGESITLHRENLASGTYFLRLTQDNKVISTEKFLITD